MNVCWGKWNILRELQCTIRRAIKHARMHDVAAYLMGLIFLSLSTAWPDPVRLRPKDLYTTTCVVILGSLMGTTEVLVG